MSDTKLTARDNFRIAALALRDTATNYVAPLLIGYGLGAHATMWSIVGAALLVVGVVIGRRESAAQLRSQAADLRLVGCAIDYTRAKAIQEDQTMTIKAEIELHQAVLDACEARGETR
jgi:hypothetical protein